MRSMTRRQAIAAGASGLVLGSAHLAHAQGRPKLRFSAAFPETDMRADAYKAFAAALKDDFDFEPYWGSTLVKQGTELVALQRGSLELCNLAPAEIAKPVPAWSLLTSAYLFHDYDHLRKTFASDAGQQFIKLARDQLGVEVIRPVYFGSRQLNLKTSKRINTPADLTGIRLRMPPGEYWQFLGESLGANPTPVAYTELYTALQSGTVDGQDNPPRVRPQRKVLRGHISQFILTRHVIAYDMLTMSKKTWDGLSAATQAKFRSEVDKVFDESAGRYDAQEADAIAFFRKQGKEVYTPDLDAFRAFAQQKYIDRYAKDWHVAVLQ